MGSAILRQVQYLHPLKRTFENQHCRWHHQPTDKLKMKSHMILIKQDTYLNIVKQKAFKFLPDTQNDKCNEPTPNHPSLFCTSHFSLN